MARASESWWEILKAVGDGYITHKVPRMSAALAYYTILSASPLLVVVLGIAGFFFGQDAVRGELVMQLRNLAGEEGARAIESMIAHAREPGANITAMAVGVVMLLVGASGVFSELQDSLNTIWEVPPQPGLGIAAFFKDRFLTFVMVFGTGFILLVTLVISAAINIATEWVGLSGIGIGSHVASFCTSLIVISLLFAMIFKVLPEVDIAWRDVWLGAGATALLFMIGEFLLGLYLSKAGIGTAYGAAGSLVVLVVWVYYSGQILLLGAEFAHAYTKRRGSHKQASEATAVGD